MSFCFVAVLQSSSRYAVHPCADGSSAWDHSVACARALLEHKRVSRCLLVRMGDASGSSGAVKLDQGARAVFETEVSVGDDVRELVACLAELSADGSNICLMSADAMISYAPLYEKMMDTHLRYKAHYTKSEGYPDAFAPELFSPVACAMMRRACEQQDIPIALGPGASLFPVVEKNINDYDIEAVLAPCDMLALRISARGNTRTNFVIGKNLWDAGLRNPDDLMELYREKPGLFRSLPRYVYAQLTDAAHNTVYDPHAALIPQKNTQTACMSRETWSALREQAAAYAEDAHLALGFGGEPALHPDIFLLLREAAESFSRVYVETGGFSWDETSAWWNEVPKNVSWIVYLDAYHEATYAALRTARFAGSSFDAHAAFTRAHDFIAMLIAKAGGENVFVQATRMNENEVELDAFCKHWKAQGAQPIIQKYNNACGRLPDRKPVDLSPLSRFACRHLERDLVFDLAGDALMCFQDVAKEHALGNIRECGMEQLWRRGEELFVQQVQQKYMDICGRCDEYYTCNA